MITRRIVLAGAAALAFTASASAQDWKTKYPELTFAVVPAENACEAPSTSIAARLVSLIALVTTAMLPASSPAPWAAC